MALGLSTWRDLRRPARFTGSPGGAMEDDSGDTSEGHAEGEPGDGGSRARGPGRSLDREGLPDRETSNTRDQGCPIPETSLQVRRHRTLTNFHRTSEREACQQRRADFPSWQPYTTKQMSDLTDKLADLLLVILAEDVAGLWDLMAEARQLDTGLSDARLREVARAVVRLALVKGWVEFVIGTLPSNEWGAISDTEREAVLSNPLNWFPPASHIAWHVRLQATPEGDLEYRKRFVSK